MPIHRARDNTALLPLICSATGHHSLPSLLATGRCHATPPSLAHPSPIGPTQRTKVLVVATVAASTPRRRCRSHRGRTKCQELSVISSSLKESSRDTWNQANHPHLRPNTSTIGSLVHAFPWRLCASSQNPSDRKLKNNVHENWTCPRWPHVNIFSHIITSTIKPKVFDLHLPSNLTQSILWLKFRLLRGILLIDWSTLSI
jgi:hypothetical protein